MAPRADVEARLDAFAEHGEALALVHHDRRMAHAELRDAVYRTARALDARGIEPGSIVVLVAGNEPVGIVARYAVNLLGAGITQPYSGLSAAARGRIVDDVEAAALLVVPGPEHEADRAVEHCAPVARIDLTDALTDGLARRPGRVPGPARPATSSRSGTPAAPRATPRASPTRSATTCGCCRPAGGPRRRRTPTSRPRPSASSCAPRSPTPPAGSPTAPSPSAARWCCSTPSTPPRSSRRSSGSASPTCGSSRRCCTACSTTPTSTAPTPRACAP